VTGQSGPTGATGPTGPVGPSGISLFWEDKNCAGADGWCGLIYPYLDPSSQLLALGGNSTASAEIYFNPNANQNSWFNVSGGRLGIGTTSPAARLDAKGTTSDNSAAAISAENSSGTSLLYVRNDGNIGIGTTSPSTTLEIYRTPASGTAPHFSFYDPANDDNTQATLGISGGSSNNRFLLQSSAGFIGLGKNSVNHSLNIYNAANTIPIILDANAANASYINAGDVGIGTTTPGAKLDVKKATEQLRLSYDGSNYAKFTVSSTGDLEINPTGNDVTFGAAIYPGETSTRAVQTNKFLVADNLNDAILTNASGWGTGGTDFAEVFDTEGKLTTGDVVEIVGGSTISENRPKVGRSSEFYSHKMLGVVTDRAGFVGGRKEGDGNLSGKIVGLIGRIPLKVSDMNGPIKLGDPLTSSTIPGVAVRANQAGSIIARALEDFDPDHNVGNKLDCPNDTIGLAKGDCGIILSFVQLSWYEPEVNLAVDGQLEIAKTSSGKEASTTASINSDRIYELRLKSGEIIQRIGVFSQANIAQIKAGLVEAQNLTIEGSAKIKGRLQTTLVVANQALLQSLQVAGKLIADTASLTTAQIEKLTTNNLFVKDKLTSPIIESDKLITKDLEATGKARLSNLQTDILSPLGQDLTIQLGEKDQPTDPAKLVIRSSDGQTLTTIDTQGNIQTNGNLTAQNASISSTLSVNGQTSLDKLSISKDTTVSGNVNVSGDTHVAGTLYADNIESAKINNLKDSFGDILKKITDYENIPSVTPTPTGTGITPEPTIYPSSTPTPTTIVDQITPTDSPTPVLDDTNNNASTESASLLPSEPVSDTDLFTHTQDLLTLNDRIEEFLASTSATIADTTPITSNTGINLTDNIILPESGASSYPTGTYYQLPSLTVTGSASLADTTISGSLLVDANLIIENSKITSLENTLYLSAFNAVDIMGGNLVIDKSGTLTVAGPLLAKSGIVTGEITPDNGNLTINLENTNTTNTQNNDTSVTSDKENRMGGFGKLLIQGSSNSPVTSIDAQGNIETQGTVKAQNLHSEGSLTARSASISGDFTTDKIKLTADDQYLSTSSGILNAADNFSLNGINAPGIRTSGTAGSAFLPLGATSVVIFNPNITTNTLIYMTPTSTTGNRTLYVSDKKAESYFMVSVDTPVSYEVKFNWWIIN